MKYKLKELVYTKLIMNINKLKYLYIYYIY